MTTAIEKQSCSHFWLPGINFFEDLSEKDQKKVLKVLREVKDMLEKFIELLTEEEEKKIVKKSQKNICCAIFVLVFKEFFCKI